MGKKVLLNYRAYIFTRTGSFTLNRMVTFICNHGVWTVSPTSASAFMSMATAAGKAYNTAKAGDPMVNMPALTAKIAPILINNIYKNSFNMHIDNGVTFTAFAERIYGRTVSSHGFDDTTCGLAYRTDKIIGVNVEYAEFVIDRN